jgi:DNA repair protein RadD
MLKRRLLLKTIERRRVFKKMLRPYQETAVESIRELYRKGHKRVLLWLVTGGGKTVIFCFIAKKMLESGKRVVVVTRGQKIVSQASDRLVREGVPHGVIMGSHRGRADHRLVQVCSITTLYKRKTVPKADLVIIDEAHFGTAPEFHWLSEQYPNAFFLPVTATPYTKKPLRHLASEIVCPIKVEEIIRQGFIVDAKYFAPAEPDLTGVRIRAGDYVETDLEKAMGRSKIVGDIVENYRKFSDGLPALCFCVSIAHATMVSDKFNESGIPSTVLHAGSPPEVRDQAIKELERGPLRVICNVGVMGVGVDIPWLRTVILARPTKSLNLYLQQIGRGSRPYQGKEHFLVLDHAGNVREHGFMTDERKPNLDGEEVEAAPRTRTCKECFAVYSPIKHPQFCPACNAEWRVEERAPKKLIPDQEEGRLVELRPGDMKKSRIAAGEEVVQEALHRIKYHLSVNESLRKPDGTPYSPWAAFYQVKTEMAGKIDEEAIVRLFRAQAKAMGYSMR